MKSRKINSFKSVSKTFMSQPVNNSTVKATYFAQFSSSPQSWGTQCFPPCLAHEVLFGTRIVCKSDSVAQHQVWVDETSSPCQHAHLKLAPKILDSQVLYSFFPLTTGLDFWRAAEDQLIILAYGYCAIKTNQSQAPFVVRWITVLPSRLGTHHVKSACWDNWTVLFRSQGTLSFAIIICRWREDASLRKVKWLGGIWPEVVTGSRTLLIMCGIRGGCAITDGLRSPREQCPISVSCSCTFLSLKAVMVQGIDAGETWLGGAQQEQYQCPVAALGGVVGLIPLLLLCCPCKEVGTSRGYCLPSQCSCLRLDGSSGSASLCSPSIPGSQGGTQPCACTQDSSH